MELIRRYTLRRDEIYNMRNTDIMVRLNTIGNPLSAGSLVTFIALSLPKDVTP